MLHHMYSYTNIHPFSERLRLREHIKQNELGLFECPQCGRGYKYKTSVYTHLRCDCGKSPKYRCKYCDFSTNFNHVFGRHIASQSHQKRRKLAKRKRF